MLFAVFAHSYAGALVLMAFVGLTAAPIRRHCCWRWG